MKKVLSLALALVMVLGMFAVASFAEGDKIAFSGSFAAAKVGETVTLTVKLDSTTVPLGGLTMAVNYNAEALEITSTEDAIIESYGMTHGTASDATIEVGSVLINTIDVKKFQSDPCTVCVITFKALKDLAASDVSIVVESALDANASNYVGVAEVTAPVTMLKANTGTLAAAITAAEEVDVSKYSEKTGAALVAAIEAGKALVGEIDVAKQSAIDAAAKAIADAIEGLKTTDEETKDALGAEIEAAKKFNAEKFSADQLAVLTAAIEAAEKAFAGDDVAAMAAAQKALAEALAQTPAEGGDSNPGTSDMDVTVFAILAVLSLVAAGFVVAKKRRA